jgi:hypothetical protein
LRPVEAELASLEKVEEAKEYDAGPVYFRLMFGGVLDLDFAERVVDSVMRGYAV